MAKGWCELRKLNDFNNLHEFVGMGRRQEGQCEERPPEATTKPPQSLGAETTCFPAVLAKMGIGAEGRSRPRTKERLLPLAAALRAGVGEGVPVLGVGGRGGFCAHFANWRFGP